MTVGMLKAVRRRLKHRLLPELVSENKNSVALVKRLLSENFSNFASRYAIAFFFMGTVAAATSLSAWIMRDVVNEIFVDKDLNRTIVISLTVIVIFAVKGFANYGQTVTLSRIGNAFVASCQRRLYAKILEQDSRFFQRFQSSDLITRMSYNAQSVRDVLNMLITSIGRDFLTLIGLVIVMVVQDPLLSAFAFLIAPPAILGISKLIRRVKMIAQSEYLSVAQIVSIVQETALGHRIIRVFGLQQLMQKRMNDAISDVERRANKLASLGARSSPLMETLGGFAFATVIFYSGWQTIEAGKSPGEFISFLTALLLAYEPAKRISRLHINLEAGLVGVRLMYQLIDCPVKVMNAPDARELVVTKGEVRFENVSFGYIPGQQVIHHVSLVVQGGQTTALVGQSGGGKSTLMSLVLRSFDPDFGQILIDGQNIREVSLESLNRNVALVTQDTVLFSGSVRENICFGRLEANQEDVVCAARAAHAHNFITQLPGGYDTMLEENGSILSGGQKQRIMIARALLKDAPILLLDEATSALDGESEAEVQKALSELMKNRTTLVIAHRLSTIKHAHSIAVITDGAVVERGNHGDLAKMDGVYGSLVRLQFGN